MRRWSELTERVAATTRTSEKTALLADYLRDLTPDELPIAAVFLTGRPFPEADPRTAGLGWAAIIDAVAGVIGGTRADLAAAKGDSKGRGPAGIHIHRHGDAAIGRSNDHRLRGGRRHAEQSE